MDRQDEPRTPARKSRDGTTDGRVFGTGIGRHRPGPDRRAVLGSVAFHVALVSALVVTGVLKAQQEVEFQTVRVKLYSPPAQEVGEPEPVVAQSIVSTPEPVVEAPKPKPIPKPPEAKREQRTAVTETPKPAEKKPAKGANPKPDSKGGENIDVNIEGQDFPYPEYLNNVIVQLGRYFRWTGSPNLEVKVAFYISRDGTIGGLRIVDRSGDLNFDMEAMSAVEQAGLRGAFGPLPDGWLADKLWIRFAFLPPG
jgi:TonB family protein